MPMGLGALDAQAIVVRRASVPSCCAAGRGAVVVASS